MDVLLRYRLRLFRMTGSVFIVSGLAFLVLARPCQPWTGSVHGAEAQLSGLTAPAGLCVSRFEG
jgi:hypothetical protein